MVLQYIIYRTYKWDKSTLVKSTSQHHDVRYYDVAVKFYATFFSMNWVENTKQYYDFRGYYYVTW